MDKWPRNDVVHDGLTLFLRAARIFTIERVQFLKENPLKDPYILIETPIICRVFWFENQVNTHNG